MLNLTIEGSIVREPELRQTRDGVWVAQITVVHNARRRDAEGKWVNKGKGLFVTVDCWRGLAERVVKLGKQTLVVVECADDLRLEDYNGFAGLRVTANNIAVSMRFDEAKSLRQPRTPSGDVVVTAEREEFDAEAYAEMQAERELASVS